MAKKLPKSTEKRIKQAIFAKADEFGYVASGRVESGQFMDTLVSDPDIGGVLKEYMEKERIRTYIKDGVLNAYTKAKKKELLSKKGPKQIIKDVYGTDADIIQSCSGKDEGVYVLRNSQGEIFVISSGTVLKWETALRKALDIIARQSGLTINDNTPDICLRLAEVGQALTESERTHITKALGAVNVKAVFCNK